MAHKISLGGGRRGLRADRESERAEPVCWRDGFLEPDSTGQESLRRSTPRRAPAQAGGPKQAVVTALSILAGALCLGALGAMSFYAINGAWATRGSMDARLRHEIFPAVAARRGFMEPLEAENAQRKMRGQAPLAIPSDRHARAAQQRPYLISLQQQLDAMQHTARSGIPDIR